MVSAIDRVTAKVGEEKSVQQAETITGSSLQQQIAIGFALEALRRRSGQRNAGILRYQSVLKMVETLMHRNPLCYATICTYLYNLRKISAILQKTPDQIVGDAKTMTEDQLEDLLMKLDQVWIQDLNSTSTRAGKWAVLRTFLMANGVRTVRLLTLKMEQYHKYTDQVLTREECRRILDAAYDTQSKLLVSLLIESLQRVGTIAQLCWGDVRKHLDDNEETFLVWVDATRTKRNVEHWAPIGKLSSYYMQKRRQELEDAEIVVQDNMPLVPMRRDPTRPTRPDELGMRVFRLLRRTGILGRRQQQGFSVRYEKHAHCFRKFGVLEMQQKGVNEEVVRYLMGQRCSAYSQWRDRYEELLKIYIGAAPSIDSRDSVQEVLDFAKSRGFSLDPKALVRSRNIRADQVNCRECEEGAAGA